MGPSDWGLTLMTKMVITITLSDIVLALAGATTMWQIDRVTWPQHQASLNGLRKKPINHLHQVKKYRPSVANNIKVQLLSSSENLPRCYIACSLKLLLLLQLQPKSFFRSLDKCVCSILVWIACKQLLHRRSLIAHQRTTIIKLRTEFTITSRAIVFFHNYGD